MSPGETIALLGTGTMGAAMGRNLLGAGFAVRAWNRTAVKAAPLAEAGASVARSPAEAASGAGILLTVLASGQRCGPVFDAIGSRTIWLGEAGAGTRLKLVVNTWLHGLMGALATTIALARALGVDPERFLGTIEGGPMGPVYARIKGDLMVAGDYPTSFSVALAAKDVRLALEAAAEGGADLPVLRAIADLYREAIDQGLGGADMAAIYEATRPRS